MHALVPNYFPIYGKYLWEWLDKEIWKIKNVFVCFLSSTFAEFRKLGPGPFFFQKYDISKMYPPIQDELILR